MAKTESLTSFIIIVLRSMMTHVEVGKPIGLKKCGSPGAN